MIVFHRILHAFTLKPSCLCFGNIRQQEPHQCGPSATCSLRGHSVRLAFFLCSLRSQHICSVVVSSTCYRWIRLHPYCNTTFKFSHQGHYGPCSFDRSLRPVSAYGSYECWLSITLLEHAFSILRFEILLRLPFSFLFDQSVQLNAFTLSYCASGGRFMAFAFVGLLASVSQIPIHSVLIDIFSTSIPDNARPKNIVEYPPIRTRQQQN